MRYLDPKNDLTFKKIFGEHANLIKSLLNALLPLADGQQIAEVEYLPSEQVPVIPELKNSIVDVRCKDNRGRYFFVEMHMFWTSHFAKRVLFNVGKAYTSQLDSGQGYESLQPVYALSLVNSIVRKDSEDYIHHFSIINNQDINDKIEGFEYVFVELPKFEPTNFSEKKMQVLWLRLLTEIDEGKEGLPEGLENSAEEIQQALEILKESSFTKKQLAVYDRYQDAARVELTVEAAAREREEKGKAEGREEGEAIGLEKGEAI
ncbi:MAG: Rpn family recombination-promoting nuclease/putative transposase, partial [Mangrovibacterium sp.]